MITPNPAISGYIGFYAGMIAITIIPFILLIKLAINTIWGYSNTYKFKRAIAGVWGISFVIFVLTAVFTVRNFTYQTSKTEIVQEERINLDAPLEFDVDRPLNDNDFRISFGSTYLTQGQLYNRDGISVNFVPSDSELMTISKTSVSRGSNKRTARKNIDAPQHRFKVASNQISIDDYYRLSNRDKYRGQKYKYVVALPLGTKIKFNGPSSIFNDWELRRREVSEKTWVMTEDGVQAEVIDPPVENEQSKADS